MARMGQHAPKVTMIVLIWDSKNRKFFKPERNWVTPSTAATQRSHERDVQVNQETNEG